MMVLAANPDSPPSHACAASDQAQSLTNCSGRSTDCPWLMNQWDSNAETNENAQHLIHKDSGKSVISAKKISILYQESSNILQNKKLTIHKILDP